MRKTSPPTEFDLRTVKPTVSRYTDWAIVAKLMGCSLEIRSGPTTFSNLKYPEYINSFRVFNVLKLMSSNGSTWNQHGRQPQHWRHKEIKLLIEVPSPIPRHPSPSPLLVAGCNDYDTKWGFNLGFGVCTPWGTNNRTSVKTPLCVIIVKPATNRGEGEGDGDGGRNLNQQFYFFVTSMLRLAAMLISTYVLLLTTTTMFSRLNFRLPQTF